MIEMRKVEPVHDLDALVEMAHDIWFEYWPTRIGVDQTAYMVEQFQSKDAIARDIAEHGYEYYFVVDKAGKTVGYVGVAPERFSGDTENPRAKEHGEAITPLHADRLFISRSISMPKSAASIIQARYLRGCVTTHANLNLPACI